MHQFTDNLNRPWSIRVDVNAIKKVRTALGLDLSSLLNNNDLLVQLAEDAVLLVDLIYVLVQTQCETAGVDVESFGIALLGDAIDNASEALLKAIIDFFPQRRRQVLTAALEAANRGQKLAMDKLDQAIANGVMDRQINKSLEKIDADLAKIFSS